LLSRGGSADALSLFKNFVGRDPFLEPLLKRRGLEGKPAADDCKSAAEAVKP
jgi:peptidyl-dipeptidase Dcp